MCICNGYVTDVVLQAPSEVSGQCSPPRGVEPATSRLPSATTTNYAKEKLAILCGGPRYLRSEFHRFTPVTYTLYKICFNVSIENVFLFLYVAI